MMHWRFAKLTRRLKMEDNYENFETRLKERFPAMFANHYGGVCTGEGWWGMIETLCTDIQNYIDWKKKTGAEIDQVVVSQIKEKFGGLRFYVDGGDQYTDGMISFAESMSMQMCEVCGKPGKRRSGGWVRTLCEEHK